MSKNRLSQDEIRSLLHGAEDVAPRDLAKPAYSSPETPSHQENGSLAADGRESIAMDGQPPEEGAVSGGDREHAEVWSDLQHLVDCLRTALSEHLRAPVQVALTGAERMPCTDFVRGCQQPTFLATSVAAGEDQEIALDIGLPILFPAINRMLGGSLEDAPISPRPLTRIETGLANRLADRVVGALLAFCGEVQPSRWKTSTENRALDKDPIALQQGAMACVDLTVRLGPASGPLRLAVPWGIFRQTAGIESQPAIPEADTVAFSVVLAETRVPRGELADLQPGDLITSPLALGELFEVRVDGQTRFRGSLGTLDGRKAFRIDQIADARSKSA